MGSQASPYTQDRMGLSKQQWESLSTCTWVWSTCTLRISPEGEDVRMVGCAGGRVEAVYSLISTEELREPSETSSGYFSMKLKLKQVTAVGQPLQVPPVPQDPNLEVIMQAFKNINYAAVQGTSLVLCYGEKDETLKFET